ncbi:MAG: ABC transporter permease [Acidobacteriota bacterium]
MLALQHILRRLSRTPGFTAIAVLTLALGIGANTAIFSVVNGVLLKPLPYPHAESLVGVWHSAKGIPGLTGKLNLSPTMYFTYGEQNQTFQEFGLWSNGGASVTGLADPEQVRALYVTPGALNALGVQPALGRWFSKEDGILDSPRTLLLTWGYWQQRMGGAPNAIGRTLNVDGKPGTIIGVMPENFKFLNVDAQVILPLRFDRNKIFLGNFSYQGIARLKPGATIQQADADIARLLPIWIQAWPAPPGFDKALFEGKLGPQITPLKDDVVGDVGSVLWVLMGTIGMVLLIACANIANLLLVRAEGRQQELAIRSALGAKWGSIAREMLLESTVLGILGGILGVALAYGGLRLLVSVGPQTLPRLNEIRIDPVTLGFALLLSLLAALLFGVVPVMKYASPQVAAALRAGGRGMSHSRDRQRARNLLVISQVALALVLLVSSGLMIRTFQALRTVQAGFTHPEELQLLRISIPEAQVKEPELVMRMQNNMLDKLAAIPGVKSVAFANGAPMEGNNSNDLLYAEDKTYATGQIPPIRRFRFVGPDYLRTAGTPLIAGREFTWTDIYDKRHVAVISENMAREMWGSPTAALGKRIREGMKDPWREIVGVAGNVYDNGVQAAAPTMVYWPVMLDNFWGETPHITRGGTFLIRSQRAGTEAFLTQVRQAIWSVNANLPIFLVRTLQTVYDQSMARTSFTLVMLAIAGAMALLLGIVGIYGVISYAVTQRTREIGIRRALGAADATLKSMFVRQALVLSAIGVVIGLAAAAGIARYMKTLLYGVTPLDPLTYAAVALVLAAAAAAASYLPARRATKVDPMNALRAE